MAWLPRLVQLIRGTSDKFNKLPEDAKFQASVTSGILGEYLGSWSTLINDIGDREKSQGAVVFGLFIGIAASILVSLDQIDNSPLPEIREAS